MPTDRRKSENEFTKFNQTLHDDAKSERSNLLQESWLKEFIYLHRMAAQWPLMACVSHPDVPISYTYVHVHLFSGRVIPADQPVRRT